MRLRIRNEEEYEKFVEELKRSGKRCVWGNFINFPTIESKSPYKEIHSDVPITIYSAEFATSSGRCSDLDDVCILQWGLMDGYTIDEVDKFINLL
jgi:hypothetical protein